MRYIVYGAGAIGGTIGGRLSQAGKEVTLIARGEHLAAIRNAGLRLEDPNTAATLEIAAAGHPAEIDFRDDDVVLLTMKSQHTQGALLDLRAAAGPAVPVFCCQNGVANEHMAARLFRHVYATVVIVPATHLEPGLVLHEAKGIGGILDSGCFPAGIDDRVVRVMADLRESGFSAEADPAVMRQKYAKLLNNLGNSLQAVCDAGAAGRDIHRRMIHEALACYEAAGIDCASRDETAARRGGLVETAPIQGRNRGGGSSWQSILRGSGSIESDYLNGEISYLGRLHGVPTPANDVLQWLGNRVAAEHAQVGSVPIEEVERLIRHAESEPAA